MPREKFVIDTSVFTNPDTREIFGNTTQEAFLNFIKLARNARKKIDFYMPPSVYEELLHFVEENELPGDAELVIYIKPPKRFEIMVPGFLLYELIEELRSRIDKGLRVAEEAVRSGEESDKTISRLRNRYRNAVRSGIIDSKEDVDLILLAMELNGALVTSDQGIAKWAEKLGVRTVNPRALKSIIDKYIKK